MLVSQKMEQPPLSNHRKLLRMSLNKFSRLTQIAICVCLTTNASVGAQENPPVAKSESITVESINAAKKEVEANQDLEEAYRTKLLEIYAQAATDLRAAADSESELKKLQLELDVATAALEAARKTLQDAPPELELPAKDAELSSVQQQLATLEEELRQAEKRRSELDETVAFRAQRRPTVPAELEATKKSLEQIETELRGADATLVGKLPQATRAALLAKRQELVAKIAVLERELPIYDGTASLLTARSDVLTREISHLRRTVAAWQDSANRRRRTDAEKNVAEATELLGDVAAPVKPLAKQLVELAEQLAGIRSETATDISTSLADSQQIEKDTARLADEFKQIEDRAKVAGFTNAVGLLLLKQRSALPNTAELIDKLERQQEQISDVHIQRIELQNQRSALSDIDASVESFLANKNGEDTAGARDELSSDVRKVLQAKTRYLDGAIQDLSSLLDRLATLDTRRRTLLAQTSQQASYIKEHILWVRSTNPLDAGTITEAGRTAKWTSSQLGETGLVLFQDAKTHIVLWIIFAIVVTALILGQRWCRTRLHDVAEQAQRRNTTSLKPTLLAIGFTTLMAAWWPTLLAFLSWRLLSPGDQLLSSTAAGAALRGCAVLVFAMDLMRHSCRVDGLGTAHFGWATETLTPIRRALRLLLVTIVPLAGVVLFLEATGVDAYHTSMGRLSLIVGLVVLAFASFRAVRGMGSLQPGAWHRVARVAWYAMGVGIPLALAVLATCGYLFSARQLAWWLVQSSWLVLAVVLISSLLSRWQLLAYRSLAMKQARKRRQELTETEAAAPVEAVALETEALTLSDSNQKLHKLQQICFAVVLIVGLGWIWNDVLPAFGFLAKVELWPSSIASGVVEGIETQQWVTLQDALFAVLTIAATLFASRNLPGLLEFAVLQRLPVDNGFKYAASTVFRYAIVALGIVLAFRCIGIGWANVQWLVAAITVGLGFGLQEIFANFVSGLILLFERPIRVGDTVTVGTVTGTVSRIRIRATTIVDWDQKELVVPNREFVTGQVVNWTLSDNILRTIIRVGVAYGSDTRLATELLYNVAHENQSVLSEPEPFVVFKQFGESTLDFELRCFVPSLTAFRTIAHELNTAIDDAFKAHNIEIAFPQRDLHIRSVETTLPVVQQAMPARKFSSSLQD